MKISDETKSKADIEIDIQLLKEWLSKVPHLPKDIDDISLSAFIHGTKSLEDAKKKIETFCTARSKFPETFGFPLRDPFNNEFIESCKFTKMFYLPKATPEGYRVIMICGFNAEKFNNHLYNVRLLMMVELGLVMWPSMSGIIMLIDTKGSNASIIPKLNIGANMTDDRYYQSAVPIKLKGIIIFNITPIVEFINNAVLKRIFSKKITDRIQTMAGDEKTLVKYFPLELLPQDYNGGTALSSEELNEQWAKLLEEKREWFLETSKLCSDESKRPPDTQDNFGIDGTFKYLTLD
ncbi:uncharacterized protein [Halyomorpha halys]|uniref:uncharacterized protein n=1 Tax=Halyomorpha halys TaxID=286706 RepID=UPI0006D500AB|nr:uncharacterized protein LOC106682392 [Halyomorpha halys]